jgi:hypothetical protein
VVVYDEQSRPCESATATGRLETIATMEGTSRWADGRLGCMPGLALSFAAAFTGPRALHQGCRRASAMARIWRRPSCSSALGPARSHGSRQVMSRQWLTGSWSTGAGEAVPGDSFPAGLRDVWARGQPVPVGTVDRYLHRGREHFLLVC